MSDIEKVDKFLTDAEVFYLASVTEENKPKCRPIVATQSPKFIRYYGKVVVDEDESLADKAFEKMPDLKKIYDENGWKMGIFHLEEATAEFRNMMAIEETYTF